MIKTKEEIDKMRIAGRLAAQVLDFIEPHVQAGITTEQLDTLCHDYIVNDLEAIPGSVELSRISQIHMYLSKQRDLPWHSS